MTQMQTTEFVERAHRAERREGTCTGHCFNSDTTGERKQKRNKWSTAIARLGSIKDLSAVNVAMKLPLVHMLCYDFKFKDFCA